MNDDGVSHVLLASHRDEHRTNPISSSERN
jgi:hypothetical protein